jgi:hypothetical protein
MTPGGDAERVRRALGVRVACGYILARLANDSARFDRLTLEERQSSLFLDQRELGGHLARLVCALAPPPGTHVSTGTTGPQREAAERLLAFPALADVMDPMVLEDGCRGLAAFGAIFARLRYPEDPGRAVRALRDRLAVEVLN